MRTLPLALLLAVALAAPRPARGEPSLRCGNRLVSVGDTKLDLHARCGRPVYTASRTEERTRLARSRKDGVRAAETALVTVEQWTYDFGPSAFVHVVTLEAGRVVDVERGSYGHPSAPRGEPAAVALATCEPAAVDEGITAYELVARCGEPAAQDRLERRISSAVRVEGGVVKTTASADVEVWIYNFGPNQFTRLVTLEGGRVVEVERGSYGY